jgi:hypothetical protein
VDLFLTDRPNLRTNPDYVDLPALFQEATGLEADAYVMATILFLGSLFGIDATNAHERSVSFNPNSFRGDTLSFSESQISSFFALGGESIEAFLRESRDLYKQGEVEPYFHLLLEKSPLVRFEKEATAVSLRALEERLTYGVYHILLNARGGPENEAARAKFMRYVGVVFEEVVVSALNRLVKRRITGKRQKGQASAAGIVLSEVELRRAMLGTPYEGKPVCDAIVVQGKRIVFVECKARKLSVSARGGRDPEQFFARFDEVVEKAAIQLDSTMRAFGDGVFSSLGVDPARSIEALPVVISLQDFHPTPLLYQRIDAITGSLGLLPFTLIRDVEIAPLEILSTSDLDWLEMAVEKGTFTLPTLLRMKRKSSIGRHQSVWNWGLVKMPVRGIGPNSRLDHHRATYERMGEAGLRFFRSHSSERDPELPNP